ncbi:hypothetical protein M422DRAFT_249917 [Sphaerobolus stellatus SS14]|uniref:Uncharacterized protein n=1 Tax=Sphaerobolus stellatus (strain SS14) TaxID=990650 RepID=A0A0C9W4Y2_SPHS4|nr:hypothetical protein M422DRAFT_249917 [Sphaerobolus stellatus SS14]
MEQVRGCHERITNNSTSSTSGSGQRQDSTPSAINPASSPTSPSLYPSSTFPTPTPPKHLSPSILPNTAPLPRPRPDLYGMVIVGAYEYERRRSWRLQTKREGCRVLEQKRYSFALMKYLVRGCHLIPTFEKEEGRYYLNDFVVNDAFIRFFLES